MQTKNCVRCFKPAKIWSGHVLTEERKMVTAGWCSKRCMNSAGFFGQYLKQMGLDKE